METIIIGVAFVGAAIYLYYSLFKKKGCGCGKDNCCDSSHKGHAK